MAGEWMVRPLRAMLLGTVVFVLVVSIASHAQQQDEVARLLAEAGQFHGEGKYLEAVPIAERAMELARRHGEENPWFVAATITMAELYRALARYGEAERLYLRSLAVFEKGLGPEHSFLGTALNNLAELYRAQGRFAEAEPLYKRALAVQEKAMGPNHPYVGAVLASLAQLYESQGRYVEALSIAKRSLAILEAGLGPEHPRVGVALSNLAGLYRAQGRYSELEPLHKRNLAIHEKAFGPEHPHVGAALNNMAALYQEQGRYAEAEPLFGRSLDIREKTLGREHPDVAVSLNNLALLYQAQGRYVDAELLFKRSLAIAERALGPEHLQVSVALNTLGELYRLQGRYTEAEPPLKRSVAIAEKVLGMKHPYLAASLNNLSLLYQAQGRYVDAEQLFKRCLDIREKALGPEHLDVGIALDNLATLYRVQGHYAEAEPLYRRSLAIAERAMGPEHPYVGASLNNLSLLYQAQGRYVDAELLVKRSLVIVEKALGSEHPNVATGLNNMAAVAYARGDWMDAAGYWRRSTGIIRRRSGGGLADGRSNTQEAQLLAWQFSGLLKATYRVAALNVGTVTTYATEMFEVAQWAQASAVATSLAQMAARSAKGSPQLAGLVRERQDLVGEWQAKDKLLIAAKSQEPAKRKAEAEKALADRLAVIDIRLAEIDQRFKQDFPDYAALASAAPVPVADVQAQLGVDEVLVLFFDTHEWRPLPEESFVWIVAKSDVRWVRSELGTTALTREVAAMRCGLDATAWDGNGRENCAKALDIPFGKVPGPNDPLPFDHTRAHKLYSALFGEAQDLIKGKHLLIVPSGPLTQLPFQVLVTKAPTPGDHRAAAWLTREHAITVLPAVSSLKALRRIGRPSAAPRPMIGFGNPLLDGPDARYAGRARLARDKQRCPETPWERVATLVGLRGGSARVETRGGLADVATIKGQTPLPETADELCAVAQNVKAAAGDVHLGAQATERAIKRLNTTGELAKYRIVHFATHGFLSGQLDGLHEPGLILTPPSVASEQDDGYLSASEIAALKLDADLVILSACNTAAGGATNAEALSGLARAFIYAQARALLVSHWEVYSDATVKLVTGALRQMTRDAKVGRSEALRRSMLALIDNGEPHESHPAYWAPFVVVGEGAAAR